jgi:cation diffusion facilitator CzcD-associated flavoprotein CzcO
MFLSRQKDSRGLTLIIGAGPAGLATSRELARAGVEHVVLERGGQVGQTWADLYDSLVLHTARGLSALPGLSFAPGTALFPPRPVFLQYLHRYAERFQLPIRTGADVVSLERDNDGWLARTASGEVVRARSAVVATGIVANPQSPDIPHRDRFRGRVFHSVEYRRPEGLAGQRVLVIGAGNSAGEIATELASAGASVTVAVRTGAAVVPRDVAGIPIQYLSVVAGLLPKVPQRAAIAAMARVQRLVRGPSVLPPAPPTDCPKVPLIGFHLADAIRNGRIQLRGRLTEFTADGVRFGDGSAQPFDTVILATGYRAALGLLQGAVRVDDCGFALRHDRVTSVDQPGLYFVGHTYDIRGGLFNICSDAKRAARRIIATERESSRTATETARPGRER